MKKQSDHYVTCSAQNTKDFRTNQCTFKYPEKLLK